MTASPRNLSTVPSCRSTASAPAARYKFNTATSGFSLAYIAKGPVGGLLGKTIQQWDALWPEVDAQCRKRKAVFLKVEPDLWEAPEQLSPVPPVFSSSSHSIQPRRTLLVDLCGAEEQVLARMKQKTRYNIRLALKKGVVVFPSSDLEAFYRLMAATGERDAFGVHSLDYYRRAYELFHPRGECELFFAEHEGVQLAALMAFAHGSTAWYFYGASADEQRECMPAYLNASDVLLLTSLHEGSPSIIKEALACNLPIVSTDVGDVRVPGGSPFTNAGA